MTEGTFNNCISQYTIMSLNLNIRDANSFCTNEKLNVCVSVFLIQFL